MRALSTLQALGAIDVKSVRRDPMLVWLALLALTFAAITRWSVPPLTTLLRARYAFDLVPYYPLLLSFVAASVPGLVGAIVGFLLLDQKDDGTLSALQVTPLTLQRYLIYRAAAPMAASLALTAVALPVSGLMTAGPGALALDAIVAAPLGPVYALFTASVAANKVQGFAVMKGSGVLAWPALFAWFVPMPWQLALGFVPHYWIAKVVWIGEAGGNSLPYAAVALVFQFGLLGYLLDRFENTSRR
jgi:fluoroquinolone transport system permease protein